MSSIQPFYPNILRDMSSGLMILDLKGYVTYANSPAEQILCRSAEELKAAPFVRHFFAYEENDRFTQLILDAVYEKNTLQEGIVPFRSADQTRTLRLKTSYLQDQGKRVGVICIMDDITELYELKDAVRAMNEIKRLNESLTLRNQLLYETFGRFLSDDIVKQLLETEDGLALGGKKREITVLMSDLRGFTALSERMTPMDLIRMLNHYLAEMTAIIQKRRGTIIEFLGDGILAVFGAPVFHEEHASDAVAAAVEMQSALSEVNRWNREQGYSDLAMGVAVHAGDVIIGNIGSEKRTKYGAVGRNVNLCGRIESFTTDGQVLISEDTLRKIAAPLTIASERTVRSKGIEQPMRLFQITAVGAPYDVHCEAASERAPLQPLAEPKSVCFHRLDGKTERPEQLEGRIVALSEQELLLDAPDLLLYENLRLQAGGDLYAKIVEQPCGQNLLRFTSKPEGFEAWKNSL